MSLSRVDTIIHVIVFQPMGPANIHRWFNFWTQARCSMWFGFKAFGKRHSMVALLEVISRHIFGLRSLGKHNRLGEYKDYYFFMSQIVFYCNHITTAS